MGIEVRAGTLSVLGGLEKKTQAASDSGKKEKK